MSSYGYAYILKYTNGAWNVGHTGSLHSRIEQHKNDLKVISRLLKQDISQSIAYLFKTDNPIHIESILLDEFASAERFHGRECFFASGAEIKRAILKLNLTPCDIEQAMCNSHRVNVVISDDARDVLSDYQERHKIGTRDEAMDKLLLEFAKRRAKT